MDVTEGEARYLLALYDLAHTGSGTSQAQLARRVGVSHPTALEMVRRMRGVGLIDADQLTLTAKGMSAALVLASRRQAAEVLARDLLAVPEAQVAAEAEALATTLSPLLAQHLVAWRAQHAMESRPSEASAG
jgi:Mn-dependent DtxR family transcriptional regulator